MPRYYNPTRGPVPLELPSGSTVAPAKSYIEIPREEEGCPSVARCVRKGLLIRPILRPKAAPKSKPAPEMVSEPLKVESIEPVIESVEDSFELPSEGEEE